MTKAEKLKLFREYIKDWKPPIPSTKERQELYETDRLQLKIVLERYKKKDIAGAYKLASSLDTIVRDQIPDCIWDDLVNT